MKQAQILVSYSIFYLNPSSHDSAILYTWSILLFKHIHEMGLLDAAILVYYNSLYLELHGAHFSFAATIGWINNYT